MDWLICHLPVVDWCHLSCFEFTHLPTFSLLCHRPFGKSAPFRLPLRAEHSSFCIFSVFIYSVKLFPSFTEPYGPVRGSAPSQPKFALRLTLEWFVWVWFGFLDPNLSAFYSISALSWISFLFCISWTILLSFRYAGSAGQKDEFIPFRSFSDSPNAGHTNGAGKPVIEFQCRRSGLLSGPSPVRFPPHGQRAELRGKAANQHFN